MPLPKGFKHSEETKAKMRAKVLGSLNHQFGKTNSEEQRQAASIANKGKIRSLETIEKWRKSRAGWKQPNESKEKNRVAHLGNQSHLGYKHSEESKEKMRKATLKKKYQRTSKLEREFVWELAKELDPIQVITKYTALSVPAIPDAFIPMGTVAIFVDGCYWHACPIHFPNVNHKRVSAVTKREKDLKQELDLINYGINVIRIWEHDLQDNISFYVNQIKNLIYWYSAMDAKAA